MPKHKPFERQKASNMPTAGEEVWWHLHTKWTASVAARGDIWNCVRWYTSPTHSPPSAWNSRAHKVRHGWQLVRGPQHGDSTHAVAIVWHNTTHLLLKDTVQHLQSIDGTPNWKPFCLSSYGFSVAVQKNRTKWRRESILVYGHRLNNYVCMSVRGQSNRVCYFVPNYKRPHVEEGGQNVTKTARFMPSIKSTYNYTLTKVTMDSC